MLNKMCLLAIGCPRAPVCKFHAKLMLNWFVSVFTYNNSRGPVSWPYLGACCSSDLPVSFQVNNALHDTNPIFLSMAFDMGPLTGIGLHTWFPLCLPENNILQRDKQWEGKKWFSLASRVKQRRLFFIFITTLLDHVIIFIVNLGTN